MSSFTSSRAIPVIHMIRIQSIESKKKKEIFILTINEAFFYNRLLESSKFKKRAIVVLVVPANISAYISVKLLNCRTMPDF